MQKVPFNSPQSRSSAAFSNSASQQQSKVIAVVVLFFAMLLQTGAQPYTIQHISGLGDTYGAWLNNAGQVVAGNSFWDGTHWFPLGSLGGGLTYVEGINDQAQIIGRSSDPNHMMQAFLWQNGSMVKLPTLGGSEGFATGINNHGQIVGYTDNAGGSVINLRATFWPTPGIATDIGALPGHGSSLARAVNDLGQVVGTSMPSTGSAFDNGAFFWDGTSIIPILTGLDPFEFTVGGLNDLGQVVGSLYSTAFLWQNGTRVSLGTLGGSFSMASAINNEGVVVGRSAGAEGSLRAFVYRDGQMIDLNTVVENASDWDSLLIAYDINDSGQIVGVGKLKGGISESEMFLLTPIPEPSAFVLIGLGAAALCRSKDSQGRARRCGERRKPSLRMRSQFRAATART